jgi:hypothetical protein
MQDKNPLFYSNDVIDGVLVCNKLQCFQISERDTTTEKIKKRMSKWITIVYHLLKAPKTVEAMVKYFMKSGKFYLSNNLTHGRKIPS